MLAIVQDGSMRHQSSERNGNVVLNTFANLPRFHQQVWRLIDGKRTVKDIAKILAVPEKKIVEVEFAIVDLKVLGLVRFELDRSAEKEAKKRLERAKAAADNLVKLCAEVALAQKRLDEYNKRREMLWEMRDRACAAASVVEHKFLDAVKPRGEPQPNGLPSPRMWKMWTWPVVLPIVVALIPFKLAIGVTKKHKKREDAYAQRYYATEYMDVAS